MDYRNRTLGGSLLFVAGVVDVLGIASGENFGSGLIWNLSVFLLGLLVIASIYFIQNALNSKTFSTLLAIAGIGAIGAALFCGCNGLLLCLVRDKPLLYYPFAVLGYLSFGLCGILSYKFAKQPFSYFCVVLGVASLIAFGVWISTFKISYSGTTMTSILVDYSQSLWLVGFGTYLFGKGSAGKPAVKKIRRVQS
jgi:hypothetical protein